MHSFISSYSAALKSKNWKNVAPIIANNALIIFSTGEVLKGKDAIQKAFTRNFELIKNDTYTIKNITWLFEKTDLASYFFDYEWSGMINKEKITKNGKGICTIQLINGHWQLIAEQLTNANH